MLEGRSTTAYQLEETKVHMEVGMAVERMLRELEEEFAAGGEQRSRIILPDPDDSCEEEGDYPPAVPVAADCVHTQRSKNEWSNSAPGDLKELAERHRSLVAQVARVRSQWNRVQPQLQLEVEAELSDLLVERNETCLSSMD